MRHRDDDQRHIISSAPVSAAVLIKICYFHEAPVYSNPPVWHRAFTVVPNRVTFANEVWHLCHSEGCGLLHDGQLRFEYRTYECRPVSRRLRHAIFPICPNLNLVRPLVSMRHNGMLAAILRQERVLIDQTDIALLTSDRDYVSAGVPVQVVQYLADGQHLQLLVRFLLRHGRADEQEHGAPSANRIVHPAIIVYLQPRGADYNRWPAL